MSEKAKGHIAMLVSVLIFALNVPITKSLMPEWIHPLGVTTLRLSFAALLFWIVSFFMKPEKIDKKDYKFILMGSIFGMSFNQVCFIIGLSHTSPVDATIIATLAPIMVMMISAYVLKEPITWKKALGVLIGASGALLIVLVEVYRQGAETNGSILGNILVFISATSYAIYMVVSKPISLKYQPITIMKWMFLLAAIMVLPFTYKELSDVRMFHEFNTSATWRLVFVLFLATFVAYMLIPVALKRIRPTTAASYNYVQPVIASAVAIAIGQDYFSWEKPTSAILVFYGVYLVTKSKSRADMEREKLNQRNK